MVTDSQPGVLSDKPDKSFVNCIRLDNHGHDSCQLYGQHFLYLRNTDFTQTDAKDYLSGNDQKYCAPAAAANFYVWKSGIENQQCQIIKLKN